MSAPDTDTAKQARQHRGPLRGMMAMVIWAVVLLVGLAIYVVSRGGAPEGAETQVDGRTGEAGEAAEPGPSVNDSAGDDAAATTGVADPTAVTVPAETVTAPDTGAGNPPDTDPGESQAAEPREPADG